MSITIVQPGTKVITVIGEIKAIVSGVCIRNESVSYEIAYFLAGHHVTEWIYRYEFEIDNTSKRSAGFKTFESETKLLTEN